MRQSKEFYEALERKDVCAAHLFFVTEPVTPLYILKARAESKALWENYKAEIKRVEEMPADMLKVEIELGFKNK